MTRCCKLIFTGVLDLFHWLAKQQISFNESFAICELICISFENWTGGKSDQVALDTEPCLGNVVLAGEPAL